MLKEGGIFSWSLFVKKINLISLELLYSVHTEHDGLGWVQHSFLPSQNSRHLYQVPEVVSPSPLVVERVVDLWFLLLACLTHSPTLIFLALPVCFSSAARYERVKTVWMHLSLSSQWWGKNKCSVILLNLRYVKKVAGKYSKWQHLSCYSVVFLK